MITLRYRQGRLAVEGGPLYLESVEPADEYPAYMYRDVVRHLEATATPYRDEALKDQAPPPLRTDLKLRDYQSEALSRWRSSGERGIVVLPTGAGKTILAVKAMEELQCSTLVVVPTVVLVDQWIEVLEDAFKMRIGALGGVHD